MASLPPLDPRQTAYCHEVMRFRRALNLTSVDDAAVFIERFVRPSLLLSPWIHQGAVVLDIGSGMGVPGVPLLIGRQDLNGILVERRKKRAEFLRHLVRTLGLRATVYGDDVTDLAPLAADVVVARAVAQPADMLVMSAAHIRKGGIALLPSGEGCIAADVPGWCKRDAFELQFDTDRKQRVFRYQRV
ncbi:MAG: RsmG family class I SAM-dependent methyltransferase [Mariprofundales bacterium]